MDRRQLRVRRGPRLHDAGRPADVLGAAAVDPDLPRQQGRLPKLTANWHGTSTSAGPMYTNIFTDRSKGANHQFTVVADYIRQHDPKKIGINYAPHFDYHDEFATATACRRSTRRSSSRRSTRSTSTASSRPRRWHGLVRDAQPARAEPLPPARRHRRTISSPSSSRTASSPRRDDGRRVEWWIRQRIDALGLDTWFHPSIDIKRSPKDRKRYGERRHA